MAARSEGTAHGVPAWLVRLCKALTTPRRFTWVIIFNILLNLLATWLFTAKDADFGSTPLASLLEHWYITTISFVVLAVITGLIWAISKLPIVESPRTLQRRYLTRRIYQTRDLAIEGIPLLPPKVQLDEIFIPVQLWPHQSDIDQLLTREQSKLLREDMRHGTVAREVELVLIDAERQFERLLRGKDRVTIADVWQSLTREHPAAVIQGYPGMGKSTLLLRLTLYMARRGRGDNDPLPEPLSPILVPLFIRLGRYATFRQQSKNKRNTSIWHYLLSAPDELDDLAAPDMQAWLKNCLEQGRCLVLFDGLDEVSSLDEQVRVQEAIKSFITDVCSRASEAASYNRFLITSRVAGYDKNAFPGYTHYIIAELTPEQIENFLPRWCRACVSGDIRNAAEEDREAYITRQAAAIEQKLDEAIRYHRGICELAENPFLLTLLAIMQQNGIDLPPRRVELYAMLTRVLLETLNVRRGLPAIPEAQAIQRLGPIAYQMQATKNSFVTQREALTVIAETIQGLDTVSQEQAQKEAAAFLERVRVRGGLFVLRTGDYLGFFHRSFQEYFAARHILHRIARHPEAEMEDLIEKARQQEDLWREPFLLAVAYKTGDEAPVAWTMISKLLSAPPGTDLAQRAHDVLLAGECMLEAKEATLPRDLERDVVLALVEVYTEALQARLFTVCNGIEKIIQSLLCGISQEAEHSVLLQTLQDIIRDTPNISRQRTALTILTVIGQSLRPCKPLVFQRLVPPLLGLAELPGIGTFQPLTPTATPDLDTIDLALAALSFLGIHGPAGQSLQQVRVSFAPHIQQLARYSLESGLLLTPVVVPLDEEHFQRYIENIQQWQKLYRKTQTRKLITDQDIAACAAIHQALLDSGEEVCYPAEKHLLRMLQISQAQTDRPWQIIWQKYLYEQIQTGTYIDYRHCILLWSSILQDAEAQLNLSETIKMHLLNNEKNGHFAWKILINMIEDLRVLSYSRNFIFFRDLAYLVYLVCLRYLEGLEYFIVFIRNLRDLIYLRDWEDLRDLRYLRHFGDLRYLRYFGCLRVLRDLGKLGILIFSTHISDFVEQKLLVDQHTEQAKPLKLLLGRIFHIQIAHETGPAIERETQHIVQMALPFVQSSDDAKDAALDIFRHLPARTKREITYILELVHNTPNEDLQQACAQALASSQPATVEAQTELEKAKASPIAVIRNALEAKIQSRSREEAESEQPH